MVKSTRNQEEGVPPGRMPDVPPGQNPHAPDYGLHVLQSVMEMQRTLGSIESKVDRLCDDVQGHGKKIDAVRLRIAWVTGVCAAMGAMFALLAFVLKGIPWSVIVK